MLVLQLAWHERVCEGLSFYENLTIWKEILSLQIVHPEGPEPRASQSSKKVKLQTSLNDKSNTVNMFILVEHQKVSTVTSSCDLSLRG